MVKNAVLYEKFSTDKYACLRHAQDASARARANACARNYKCAGTAVRIVENPQFIRVIATSEILTDAPFSGLTKVCARQLHASCACALRRAVSDTFTPQALKSLFFLSGCSNPNAVQVDSRLHLATSPLLISGEQHGEEEKEGSGEEDEASEEEVTSYRFEIFDDLNSGRRLLRTGR